MRRNRGGFGINSRGLSTIGWLITMPIVLLILAIGFYEGRKAYWDYRVKGMCEKDGGVKVFQTVELNEQEYALFLNKFGQLDIPLENRAVENVPIVHSDTRTYVHRGNPEVWRYQLVVIRKSDKKALGVRISYARVGGDLFALHPSRYLCPEKSEDLFSAIVHKTKVRK